MQRAISQVRLASWPQFLAHRRGLRSLRSDRGWRRHAGEFRSVLGDDQRVLFDIGSKPSFNVVR